MDEVAELIFQMSSQGVSIWAEGDQLRYRAPQGKLTSGELSKLRALKPAILAYCRQSILESAEFPLQPRLATDRVPLTFSQLWWWNRFHLEHRPSMRPVAGALRLSGRLDLNFLNASVLDLVRRHDALRTRIVAEEGSVLQQISEVNSYGLELIDLTVLPMRERDAAARSLAEKLVIEGFLVSCGPLFSTRLLKLAENEHVLVVALDHIISDAVSIGILWREILSLYECRTRGVSHVLPHVPIQFADYAIWLHRTDASWRKRHWSFWDLRLTEARPAPVLPVAETESTGRPGWAKLSIVFEEELCGQLHELSRRAHTTQVMTFLALYAAVTARCCGQTDFGVLFTTMGRLRPELACTIGFFGVPLLLHVRLHDHDSFLDLLAQVTREYGLATEHDDAGRVVGLIPSDAFGSYPYFNWIPRNFDSSGAELARCSETSADIALEPYEFEIGVRDDVEWDGEIGLCLSASQSGVAGEIVYRSDHFPIGVVAAIHRNLRRFALELVRNPSTRLMSLIYDRGGAQ